jgi:hypothetical protein
MSSIITRLYGSHADAEAAIADLLGNRFRNVALFGPGNIDEAALVAEDVAAGTAKVYVEAAGATGSLVTVHAPFGHANDAITILERHNGTDLGTPDNYLSVIDNAAPLSSLFGLPVLSKTATPLSSLLGLPALSARQRSKTELLQVPAPFSRMFGLRTLAGDATPLSSRFNLKVLSDDPAPFSNYIGIGLLSKNPAPLSTLLGLPLLLRTDK